MTHNDLMVRAHAADRMREAEVARRQAAARAVRTRRVRSRRPRLSLRPRHA